jgi:hypothetical protein
MEDGFRRVLPADACTGKVPHPGDSGRSAGEAATGPHAPNRTVILNARSILSATWRITGLPLLAVTLEAGLRQGGVGCREKPLLCSAVQECGSDGVLVHFNDFLG